MLKLIKVERGREVERAPGAKRVGARQINGVSWTAEESKNFLSCLIGDATHHLALIDFLDNDELRKAAIAIEERLRQRGVAERGGVLSLNQT